MVLPHENFVIFKPNRKHSTSRSLDNRANVPDILMILWTLIF